MRPSSFGLVAGVALWLAGGHVARAYTIATSLTPGCHERLTGQALRAVRADPGLAAVAAPRAARSDNDEALVSDLPFTLDPDLRDLEAAALLVGVRDNDLKGLDAADLAALPTIHSDPNTQREHTLRRPEQDEPTGSEGALTEARNYVDSTVAYALAHGLTSDGAPDPAARTKVALYLSLRGAVKPELPLFWVYLGQALHALQDSYSHTYRVPDGHRVSVVLNWIDYAEDRLIQTRDGPAHLQQLDRCERLDDLRAGRWALAAQASEQLLRAALAPGVAIDQRRALVASVLDAHMSFAPGCTAANRWCDAAEQGYDDPGACACQLGQHTGGAPAGHSVAITVALILLALRRRGRTAGTRRWLAGPFLLCLARCLALPAPARADPPRACVPGQQIACGCPAGLQGAQICRADGSGYEACGGCATPAAAAPETASNAPPLAEDSRRDKLLPPPPPEGARFALAGWTGGALDRTALAGGIGMRYALSPAWMAGLGAEWNPWVSLDTRRIRAGSLNLAATLIRRYQVTPRLSLRTSLHLGGSVLLFGLYGAPAGSVGPFAALSWLGLDIEISRRWRLIIDPMEVAVPVPQARGVPLVYRQYRFVVGVQLGD
jgi:hypothetical protein